MAVNTNSIDLESSTSDYLTAATLAAYAPSSYTIEMWLKVEAFVVGAAMFTFAKFDNAGAAPIMFCFGVGSNANKNIYHEHYGSAGQQHIVQTTETGILTAGTWAHVAVTNNAGTFLFYLNGVAQTTTITLNNYAALGDKNTPLTIGTRKVSGTYGEFFDGKMDDVRFWNTVRTAPQILANYQTELVGNESGLIGYWKMNEGSGSTVADQTSNANTMTLTGSPVFSTDVPFTNRTSGGSFLMNFI